MNFPLSTAGVTSNKYAARTHSHDEGASAGRAGPCSGGDSCGPKATFTTGEESWADRGRAPPPAGLRAQHTGSGWNRSAQPGSGCALQAPCFVRPTLSSPAGSLVSEELGLGFPTHGG